MGHCPEHGIRLPREMKDGSSEVGVNAGKSKRSVQSKQNTCVAASLCLWWNATRDAVFLQGMMGSVIWGGAGLLHMTVLGELEQ